MTFVILSDINNTTNIVYSRQFQEHLVIKELFKESTPHVEITYKMSGAKLVMQTAITT